MRPGRVVRLLFGIALVLSFEAGCGDSGKNPNVDAEGKAITAPVRPGLKAKAADKMKKVMPHL